MGFLFSTSQVDSLKMLPSFYSRDISPSSPLKHIKLAFTNKRYLTLAICITTGLLLLAWLQRDSLYPSRLYDHSGHPRPWKAPPPGPPTIWSRRADAVREAFVYAYEGYRVYAMPHDELKPMSGKSVDK